MITDFHWSEHLPQEQYPVFHTFYSKEWWTKGRSLSDVTHMLEHCDLTLFCHDAENRIAAFARVLTDYTFKAMIFDVIVDEKYRGEGLGRVIIERIMSDARLKPVKSFELYCPDRLVPFYEKLGFVRSSSFLLCNRPKATMA